MRKGCGKEMERGVREGGAREIERYFNLAQLEVAFVAEDEVEAY